MSSNNKAKSSTKASTNIITAYFMTNGVLMTSNNGFDREKNPVIPFREFLEDIWNGLAVMNPNGCKAQFSNLVIDMIEKEFKFLPTHMKQAGIKVIENFIADIEKAFELKKAELRKAERRAEIVKNLAELKAKKETEKEEKEEKESPTSELCAWKLPSENVLP
jgi:hypothetical protein